MFQKLVEFDYQRSFKEAFGFYLAYLLVVILLGGLMGGAVGIFITSEEALFLTMRMGALAAVITSLVLSFLILKEKNLLGDFKYIVAGLMSGILALFGGGLLGLIPVAFLTTQEKKVEEN